MHKQFYYEYSVTCCANLGIFHQIFTLDFAKTLFIIIVQLLITLLVRVLFQSVTNKINSKK